MATVYSFHVGRPLNLWERCCLQSFVDHDHSLTVFSYEAFERPPGVKLAQADDIIPRSVLSKLLAQAPNAFAQFSDLFRYELLVRQGGWWFDTDVLCLSESFPEQDLLLVRKSGDRLHNCVIYSEPAHPLMVAAVEYSKAHLLDASTSPRDFLGPTLISRLVKKQGLQNAVVEDDVFCPIRGEHVYDFLDPQKHQNVTAAVSRCPAIHLFQETFRRVDFPRDILPPAGSFLADQFIQHGGAGLPHVDVATFRQAARQEMERKQRKRQRRRWWWPAPRSDTGL